MSDSLQPHGPQHARPPCPSSTAGVYSNSCLLSRWCHPAISSSVIPFSSCPQSLSASGSFPMSQLFAWGDQSIGVSASASVLPMNTQDWSPLGWTSWISLQSKELWSLLQHHSSKASILQHSAFFIQVNYNLIVDICAVIGTFPFLWNVYFRLLWWCHFWTQHCSLNLPLHILHSCNNVHLLDTSADLLPAGSTTNVVTCVHKTCT